MFVVKTMTVEGPVRGPGTELEKLAARSVAEARVSHVL